MLLLQSADMFKINVLFKNIFQDHYQMSNSLDPDHDRRSVSPCLGPNFCKGYQSPLARKGFNKGLFVLVVFLFLLPYNQ